MDATRRTLLASLLTVNDALLLDCCNAGCITAEQMSHLRQVETGTVRNAKLIEMLTAVTGLGRSRQILGVFATCLRRQGQRHAEAIVEAKGVLVEVDVDLDASGRSVEAARQTQNLVVFEALKLLPDKLADDDRLSDILRPLASPLEPLESAALRLCMRRHGAGIAAYFGCGSRRSLEHLRELYAVNNQLRILLEKFFVALLKNRVTIRVDRLDWSDANYERCLQHFDSTRCDEDAAFHGPTYINISRNGQNCKTAAAAAAAADEDIYDNIDSLQPTTDSQQRRVSSADQPPPMLFRQRFTSGSTADRESTEDDGVYVAPRDRRVSAEPRPPDFEARIAETLAESHPVYGLTLLNNQLYVLFNGETHQISVYDITTSDRHKLLRRLTIPGTAVGSQKLLNDIASCSFNHCLYVSDPENRRIHRLSVDNGRKITRWTTVDAPWGLSVTFLCHNLLVTCREARRLVEFTTDGRRIREVPLDPDVVSPSHAVQLSTGQLVVCHGSAALQDPTQRVCVVEPDGGRALLVGDSYADRPMSGPCHLAVDGNDFVFVADSCNDRLLLLSPTMRCVRDIVSRDTMRGPYRLCLDVERRRLYVAQYRQVSVVDLVYGK